MINYNNILIKIHKIFTQKFERYYSKQSWFYWRFALIFAKFHIKLNKKPNINRAKRWIVRGPHAREKSINLFSKKYGTLYAVEFLFCSNFYPVMLHWQWAKLKWDWSKIASCFFLMTSVIGKIKLRGNFLQLRKTKMSFC